MKKFFLLLLVSMSLMNAAEDVGQGISNAIIADQVKQIREMILESSISYEAVAGHFFSNVNYKTFIGPDSPLDPLCKDVHTVLEEKRKWFWGTRRSSYKRLQQMHAFLAACQEQDPKNTYAKQLAFQQNERLRKFHKTALAGFMSKLKRTDLTTNGIIQVVATDVETRRLGADVLALQSRRRGVIYEDDSSIV